MLAGEQSGDYVLYTMTKIQRRILQLDGQWDEFVEQKNYGVFTASLHCIEILSRRLFKEDVAWNEKFTLQHWDTIRDVVESVRKSGLINVKWEWLPKEGAGVAEASVEMTELALKYSPVQVLYQNQLEVVYGYTKNTWKIVGREIPKIPLEHPIIFYLPERMLYKKPNNYVKFFKGKLDGKFHPILSSELESDIWGDCGVEERVIHDDEIGYPLHGKHRPEIKKPWYRRIL